MLERRFFQVTTQCIYLKNNFQLVDKNIEGTQTRCCTLFYPLCVCSVATGKHFDWVSQNSERILILIKLNNNMMLYWFIGYAKSISILLVSKIMNSHSFETN